MRATYTRSYAALLRCICFYFCYTAAALSGTVDLVRQDMRTEWNGRQLNVIAQTRFTSKDEKTFFNAEIIISDFYGSLAGTIESWSEGDRCGIFSASDETLVELVGPNLQVRGKALAQRWTCITTEVPEVRGLKITKQRRIIGRSLLSSNSSEFCVRLVPHLEYGALIFKQMPTCDETGASHLDAPKGLVDHIIKSVQDLVSAVAGSPLAKILPGQFESMGPEVSGAKIAGKPDGRVAIGIDGTLAAGSIKDIEGFRRSQNSSFRVLVFFAGARKLDAELVVNSLTAQGYQGSFTASNLNEVAIDKRPEPETTLIVPTDRGKAILDDIQNVVSNALPAPRNNKLATYGPFPLR